jgi:uncharacterized protein YjiS (DUF1127 family)
MALVHGDKYAANSSAWTPRLFWLIDRLQEWCRAVDDQHYLASLNDHNLRDLGLSRHDVDQDATFRDRLW